MQKNNNVLNLYVFHVIIFSINPPENTLAVINILKKGQNKVLKKLSSKNNKINLFLHEIEQVSFWRFNWKEIKSTLEEG